METPDGVGALLTRACDPCRTKKVRCDRLMPCGNCRLSKIECNSTTTRVRKQESRQRVLISAEYEAKIDRLESQLSSIMESLQGLQSSVQSQQRSSFLVLSPSPIDQASHHISLRQDQHRDHEQGSEGTSNLMAHAQMLPGFLDRLTKDPSDPDSRSQMASAIQAARYLIRTQSEASEDMSLRFQHTEYPLNNDFRMPPIDVALNLLQIAQKNPALSCSLVFPFVDLGTLTDCCRKVYFPADRPSLSTVIISNGGLWYLLTEAITRPSCDYAISDLSEYCSMCSRNMEKALAVLDLLLPANLQSIQALLIGVCYCIEVSKPAVGWRLNCAAAQLCQIVGYDRRDAKSGDAIDQTSGRTAFCFSYLLDKGLALRLGRAPTVHQTESIACAISPSNGLSSVREQFIQGWIEQSAILEKVYEDLYSPQAFSKPQREIVQAVEGLAQQVHSMLVISEDLWSGLSNTDENREETPLNTESMQVSVLADIVSHYSALTMIYQAMPTERSSLSQKFVPQCTNAARSALDYHLLCMNLTAATPVSQAAYLNWTVLYTPFTCFIVLFYHIVEAKAYDDLSRMQRFHESLAGISRHSNGIDKIRQLAKALHKIGRLYLESSQGNPDMFEEMIDFDFLMTELWPMPFSAIGENIESK